MKNGFIVDSCRKRNFDDYKPEQIEKFQKAAQYFADAIDFCKSEVKKEPNVCDPENCVNFQKEGYSCYQCCRSDVWGDKCYSFEQLKLNLYINGKEYDYTNTNKEFQNCLQKNLGDLDNKFFEENKSPEQKFIEKYLEETPNDKLNYQDAMKAAIKWAKSNRR